MVEETLSVLASSLPGPLAESAGVLAEMGFGVIDVVAVAERPAADRAALADAGVRVGCVALGRGLPPGVSLDALSATTRRQALDEVKRQLTDAAQLGATSAYLIPPADDQGACLAAYTEACCLVADHAASRMIEVCVEPVPGRLLPDCEAVLGFLQEADHPNLGLLLDVGHCLISGEDPAALVRLAGPRLAYLHLDDNDGINDVHWPLLTGRLTEEHLRRLGLALRAIAYDRGMALELKPGNTDPRTALELSKTIAEKWL